MFSPKKVMEFFSPSKNDAGEKREGRAFVDFYVLFSLGGHEDKLESECSSEISQIKEKAKGLSVGTKLAGCSSRRYLGGYAQESGK